MKNANRTKRAFTLIEIMIVVLIIGILLGIAVPNFARARETARAKSCVANLKAMDAAHQQRLMTHNWPSDHSAASPEELVSEGYLKTKPECPSGGFYAYNSGRPDPYPYVCTRFMGGPITSTSHAQPGQGI